MDRTPLDEVAERLVPLILVTNDADGAPERVRAVYDLLVAARAAALTS